MGLICPESGPEPESEDETVMEGGVLKLIAELDSDVTVMEGADEKVIEGAAGLTLIVGGGAVALIEGPIDGASSSSSLSSSSSSSSWSRRFMTGIGTCLFGFGSARAGPACFVYTFVLVLRFSVIDIAANRKASD